MGSILLTKMGEFNLNGGPVKQEQLTNYLQKKIEYQKDSKENYTDCDCIDCGDCDCDDCPI